MTMTHTSHFLIGTLMCFLFACAPITKDQFLDEQRNFITEVKAHHSDYTEADWARKNEELNTMLEEQYPRFEDEMTVSEKVNLWGQVVAYHMYQTQERTLDDWEVNEEKYLQMLETQADEVEELGEIFEQEIAPELEKMLPKLKEVGQEFIEKLEDQGTLDRLKDHLEKLGQSVEDGE